MKATVNEDCIGCGLCEGTCPDVFSISDDGVAVAIEEDVPEEAEDATGLPRLADLLALKKWKLLDEGLRKKMHEKVYLGLRTRPVLGREGVHGQVFQTDLLAVGGDGAEVLRPRGVAGGAGQAALFGPAAVAVHDDGDVPGQMVEVHLRPGRRLF